MNKSKKFIKEVIAIDETKTSLIMVMMVISFIVGMWQVISQGDISGNLLQLLFMLIGAVTGINAVNKFTSKTDKGEIYGEYSKDGIRLETTKDTRTNRNEENYYQEYQVDEKYYENESNNKPSI